MVKSAILSDFSVPLCTRKNLPMKKLFCVFLFPCVLLACTGSSIKEDLDTYEQRLERTPKQVYEELLGVQEAGLHLSDEDEARLAILTIKAKDLAYIPLEGQDSVPLRKAIDYYREKDDWQMLMWGYYLLGGVYRDMGDAPKGVEAYMKVIEVADTTKSDCNYRVMARAMAQKSELQQLQNVMPRAVESIQQAECYAYAARDTAYAFYCEFLEIGLHCLNRNYSPLIKKSPKLIQDCLSFGDTLLAVHRTVGYAWYYIENGLVTEADSMLALYDRYDGRPYPIYYGTKGEAHLAHGRLDSAEYYFRKELVATDWNNRQTAYRGLKKVFEGRNQLDSALKYATLQCDAVDSDYKHKVSEDIVQMEQVYNYEAEKERANRVEMERAQLQRLIALLLLAMVLIGGAVVAFFWQRRVARMREKQLRQEKEAEQLKVETANAVAQMAKMESSLMQYQVEMERQRNSLWRIQQELDMERARQVEAQEEQQKSRQRIQNLEAERQEAERVMAELQEDIQRKEEELATFREDARQMSNMADGVKAMRTSLGKEKPATQGDWEALQKEVHRLYPDFIKDLRKQVADLNDTELRVAMLLKMGFTPSEIATLTGLSPSTVTKSRRRLYEKAFGKEPKDMEEVDEWISN